MDGIIIVRSVKIIIGLLILFFWPVNYVANNSFTFPTQRNAVLENTIFYKSHNDEQMVVQRGNLYPSIWLSRMFQNKPSIVVGRFEHNLFALLDLNNYFFGFHPREGDTQNQNLQKFPALSIILLVIGLYNLLGRNRGLLILVWLILGVIGLSMLRNFDGFDLLLYIPMSVTILIGLEEIIKHKTRWIWIGILFAFSLVEYLQIFSNLGGRI